MRHTPEARLGLHRFLCPQCLGDFSTICTRGEWLLPCPFCPDQRAVQIDETIFEAIRLFWQKGLRTSYCCGGHEQENPKDRAYCIFIFKSEAAALSFIHSQYERGPLWFDNDRTARDTHPDLSLRAIAQRLGEARLIQGNPYVSQSGGLGDDRRFTHRVGVRSKDGLSQNPAFRRFLLDLAQTYQPQGEPVDAA